MRERHPVSRIRRSRERLTRDIRSTKSEERSRKRLNKEGYPVSRRQRSWKGLRRNIRLIKIKERRISLVGFYGISTIVGYLMPNPLYTYILNIYDLVGLGFMTYQTL